MLTAGPTILNSQFSILRSKYNRSSAEQNIFIIKHSGLSRSCGALWLCEFYAAGVVARHSQRCQSRSCRTADFYLALNGCLWRLPGNKAYVGTKNFFLKKLLVITNGYGVVFLNKAEEENCYYLSHGKSSLFISLTDTGYIVPLDYKLNKEVKEQWENRLSEYLAWFEEKYY